jgi:hypothetical protein
MMNGQYSGPKVARNKYIGLCNYLSFKVLINYLCFLYNVVGFNYFTSSL